MEMAGDAVSDGAILTINSGSSSVKFAVFDHDVPPGARILSGEVERIGTPDVQLTLRRATGCDTEQRHIHPSSPLDAAALIAGCIREELGAATINAIGHRIVHGGLEGHDHQRVTPAVIDALRRAVSLDRNHLPREIALIESFARLLPGRPQVACLDTAFHRDLPEVAWLLPIPREFTDAGVRRLGFHGLSYTSLMQQLEAVAGPDAANGRVILAHLGSGASMAAVHRGKPVDTTMGLTPLGGLVMATRPGDLDPGLLLYLMREYRMSVDEMDDFVAKRCGLLAVSQTSGDMRDLLAIRSSDVRARQAIDLFCHQARKHLCALAGTLGGVDTIVFSGGIGQHAPEIRSEILDSLGFLGIELSSLPNAQSAGVISSASSRVTVRVMPTDEEQVMFGIVGSVLKMSDH